ncbi:MAG: helix-turn-helix transcriptional regulator [Bacteroidota bacterium]
MINRNVETNKLFGIRLREERIAKGMSQHQLWLESGIFTSQIGKIERGVANPTLSTIVALAKALQVSLDILLPPDLVLNVIHHGE